MFAVFDCKWFCKTRKLNIKAILTTMSTTINVYYVFYIFKMTYILKYVIVKSCNRNKLIFKTVWNKNNNHD